MTIIPCEFEQTGLVSRWKYNNEFFRDKPIQSVCYDAPNGRYIVGFSDNDPQKSTLVKMRDLNFTNYSIEMMQEGVALLHCNDMTYDPKTRRIFVACGDKTIRVVNPVSLTIERAIPIDVYAWSIARYPNGDFFIHDGNGGYRYSQNFLRLNTVSSGDNEKILPAMEIPYDSEKKKYQGFWQGAFMVGDIPFMIYTQHLDPDWVFKYCMFVSIGTAETEVYRFETSYEVEGACIVGDRLRLVFGNNYFGGGVWDMNELNTKIIYATFKSISAPVGRNVELDCSKYVPTGYSLVSANVNFKKDGKTLRALPYSSDDGKILLRVLKVASNKVTLKSTTNFDQSDFQVIGICRRKD